MRVGGRKVYSLAYEDDGGYGRGGSGDAEIDKRIGKI